MKKFLTILGTMLVCSGVASAALDTSTLSNSQVLPVEQPTLLMDSVSLIDPISKTNLEEITGTVFDISDYKGKGLITAGFSTGPHASITSTVTVLFGYATGSVDAVTNTYTQSGTDASKVDEEEIDFDTLKGTNASLFCQATYAVSEGTTPVETIVDVGLIRNSARSATQTVTSDAFDRLDATGVGTMLVSIGAAALGEDDFAATAVVQSSATGTSAWSAVSGVATATTANAVTALPIDCTKGNRYLRIVATTTNDVAPIGATFNYYSND